MKNNQDTLIEQALGYEKLGWSVVPIPYGEKRPYIKWKPYQFKRATSDIIRFWWEKWPDANIGIITGRISSLVVLDFDSLDALSHFNAAVYELPETIRQKTGREDGGMHFLFKYPEGVSELKSKAGILPNFDLRADSGLIVVAPSIHKSGKRYQWVGIDPLEYGLDDLLEMPDDVLDLCQNGCRANESFLVNGDPAKHNEAKTLPGISIPEDAKNVDLDAAYQNGVPEGLRDWTCTRLAGRFLPKYTGDVDKTFLELSEWNKKNQPPMDDRQVRKCVESIAKREAAKKKPISIGNINSDDIIAACSKNQDGDAELLVRLCRNRFVYDHAAKTWYKWYGHFWGIDKVDEIIKAVDEVINLYRQEAIRQQKLQSDAQLNGPKSMVAVHKANQDLLFSKIRNLQRLKYKKEIVELSSKGLRSLGITGEEWDKKPLLLPCQNGVISLRDGNLHPGKPGDFLKTACPTNYRPNAATPIAFQKFLRDILPDKDIRNFVKRLFGYSLIGGVSEHILPIFYGQYGRNGKDTLIQALAYVLGPFADPVNPELLLEQRSTKSAASPSPEIVALRGKRIVWASETNKGRSFDTSKAKSLSGGNTLIGRLPYDKRDISFEPSHTLFLLTNNAPRALEDDHAFWERVQLVPFEVSFVRNPDPSKIYQKKADKNLSKRLEKEAEGILRWLVEGCLEFQKTNDINPPSSIGKATGSYRLHQDSVAQFASRCCQIVDGKATSASELYAAYERWCEFSGYSPLSLTKFGRKMKDKFVCIRFSQGNFYKGVVLSTEGEIDGSFQTELKSVPESV